MPGFWKTFKKSLGDVYDYLGLVLVTSFIWFGISLGLIGFSIQVIGGVAGILGALVAYVLVVAPLTAGGYFLANQIVTRNDPSWLDLFDGTRKFLYSAWLLGLTQVLITLMLISNAAFYLTRDALVMKILGVLLIYLMIVWAFSLIYHFPLLIEQRPGALKVVKRSFLITFDNIAFTVGAFSVIIVLTCLLALTLLGLPLLFLGMTSILSTRALRASFVKYGIIEPEREQVEDKPFHVPEEPSRSKKT